MSSDMVALNKDQLYALVVSLLAEMFELDPASMSLQSRLVDDLDIDSIDAVDLAVRLKQITGKRLQSDVFKTIRTISDVIEAIAVLPPERSSSDA